MATNRRKGLTALVWRALRVCGLAALIASMLAASLGPPSPARAAAAWSALGSGMNGSVPALAADSAGNLYAGGPFTAALVAGMAAPRPQPRDSGREV